MRTTLFLSAALTAASAAAQEASLASSLASDFSTVTALASSLASDFTSATASLASASIPPHPSFSINPTNPLISLGKSLESAASSYFGPGVTSYLNPTGYGANLPTATGARSSFISFFESAYSVDSNAVASATGHVGSMAKQAISADMQALSSLKTKWDAAAAAATSTGTGSGSTMTTSPASASAATAVSSSSTSSGSTGSSNGAAAPIVTVAPVVLGGVAAAALALL